MFELLFCGLSLEVFTFLCLKKIEMGAYSLASTQISTYLCGKRKTMIATTYSAFRSNLKHYLDRVTDDAESVIINREGEKAVVIISMEEFEAMHETQHILSSPKVMEAMAAAEKDIREGNYQIVDPYAL